MDLPVVRIRQYFLTLLFAVLLMSDMFGWKLGFAQGLSVKNAFLYAFVLLAFIDMPFRRARLPAQVQLLHLGFLLLVIAALLSWSFTDARFEVPMYSREERLASIKGLLVDLFLFFAVYFYGVQTRKQAISVAKALLLLVFIANVVTVLDVYNIPDLGVIQQMDDTSALNEGRLKGPIGEPNQYAAFLLIFLPSYFALAFDSDRRKSLRVTYACAAVVTLVTFFLTGSRGGGLGLVVGVAWGAWLLRRTISFTRVFKAMIFLTPVFAASLGLVAVRYSSLLLGRVEATTNQIDFATASAGRLPIWEAGIGVMLDHPMSFLIGIGWQTFATYVGSVPHNTYLGYLFALGVLGLALFVMILGCIAQLIRRAALLAIGEPRSLLIGYLLGYTALLVCVFFVDLFATWHFIWAFTGVIARLAVIELSNRTNSALPNNSVSQRRARFSALIP